MYRSKSPLSPLSSKTRLQPPTYYQPLKPPRPTELLGYLPGNQRHPGVSVGRSAPWLACIREPTSLASGALARAAIDAGAATGRLASDETARLAAARLAGVGDDTAAGILACNDGSAGAGHALWVGYVVSPLPYCNIAAKSRLDSPLLSRASPSEPRSGPARAVAARPSIERKKVVFMVKDVEMVVRLSCGLRIACWNWRGEADCSGDCFLTDGNQPLYLYPSRPLVPNTGPLLHGLRPRKSLVINVVWCTLNTSNRPRESPGHGASVTIQ